MSVSDCRSIPDGPSGYYRMSVRPQHRYKVTMRGEGGRAQILWVKSGSFETIRDQIKHGRLATMPGMTEFEIEEFPEFPQPGAVSKTAPDHFHQSPQEGER